LNQKREHHLHEEGKNVGHESDSLSGMELEKILRERALASIKKQSENGHDK